MKSLEDRLYDLAGRLAQELKEIRDDCVEASGDESDMAGVKALLDDCDRLSSEWLSQPRTDDLFERNMSQVFNSGDGTYRP